MRGSATLAIVVSITCITVASMVETATRARLPRSGLRRAELTGNAASVIGWRIVALTPCVLRQAQDEGEREWPLPGATKKEPHPELVEGRTGGFATSCATTAGPAPAPR